MILDKEVKLYIRYMDFKKYRDMGYIIPDVGIYSIKVEDMNINSQQKVLICCDDCKIEKVSTFKLHDLGVQRWGKYYCTKCVKKYMDHKKAALVRKETNIEKFGVEHTLQSKEIREKGKQTNIEKYGVENIFQSEEFKEKKRLTMLEKYGVEHSSHSEKSNEKRKKTNMERYGDEYSFNSLQTRENRKNKTLEKYKEILDKNRYEILEYDNEVFVIFDKKYNDTFEITHQILYKRIVYKTEISVLENPIGQGVSQGELRLKEFISSLSITFISNDKKVLKGKELDIYIQEYNLALEYNGLYWHDEAHSPNDYHQNKSIMCKEKGVRLIHIFEDDWKFKTEFLKKYIKECLNIYDKKVEYGNHIIKSIENDETEFFINQNSLEEKLDLNYNIGLYIKDELILLFCLVGENKLFLCKKVGIDIAIEYYKILLDYFKNIENLESYINFSYQNGKILENLGFEYKELLEPVYYWTYNVASSETRKKIKNYETEMYDDGYKKIYSTGYLKYVR